MQIKLQIFEISLLISGPKEIRSVV